MCRNDSIFPQVWTIIPWSTVQTDYADHTHTPPLSAWFAYTDFASIFCYECHFDCQTGFRFKIWRLDNDGSLTLSNRQMRMVSIGLRILCDVQYTSTNEVYTIWACEKKNRRNKNNETLMTSNAKSILLLLSGSSLNPLEEHQQSFIWTLVMPHLKCVSFERNVVNIIVISIPTNLELLIV